MKKVLYTTLVLFIAGLVYIVMESKETVDYKREVKKAAKASVSTKEDPFARHNFELKRLASPLTKNIPAGIREKELAFASKLPVKGEFVNPSLKKESAALGTWTLRGPYNVGGRTRALAMDVSDESRILAGGVSGGMWLSEDDGASWSKTTQAQQLHSVTCLAQDTREGKRQTWYFGTGEAVGNSAISSDAWYSGDGIYKSTDGGESWSVLASTQTGKPQSFDQFFDYVWNVATDPSNSSQDEVYAAVFGGIYRSTNGGGNWSQVKGFSNPNYAYFTDVAVSPTGVVYASLSSDGGADGGIWRSTDGVAWTDITPDSWPGQCRRIVIGMAPSNENILYFLSESPGSGLNDHSLWKYTYLSGDGTGAGGTWENRSAAIPDEGDEEEGGATGDFTSQNSYDLVITVKPDNPDVVFIGGRNLWRSTNGFSDNLNTTWIGGYVSSNDGFGFYVNHHPDQHSLAFSPSNPDILLSGHDGGLSKTTDCIEPNVSWSLLNKGYYTSQFYTVAIDPEGTDDVIIGGMQDNGTFRVRDNSIATTNWNDILSGDGSFCEIAPGKSHYYASWQNGETYRLQLDGNGNWTVAAARVDPAGGSNYLFINPFLLDPNVPQRLYMAGGNVLWRNSDATQLPTGGNYDPPALNWTKMTNSQIDNGSISALGISKTPADRLYFGTSEGKVYRIDNAHEGNPSATDISDIEFPEGYINCISFDPLDAEHILVAFSNYELVSLWSTTDGGANWQAVSGNLEENINGSGTGPSVRWAEILPTNDGNVYFAATSTGLYSTTNLGGTSTTWEQEGASTIGNVVVDMIASRTTDNLVVVGTHGNGVYSSIIGSPAAITEDDKLPQDFYLGQNYPNPFNPSTTISYTISGLSDVNLEIFNIRGRSVITLVRQNQSAGTYHVRWNGHNRTGQRVPSGIYMYRLTAGNKVSTKQMILIK